jgi:hypothetical protein
MQEYWSETVQLRIRIATVFQGGGIRGLFFPGHLIGLVRSGIEKIFVLAGASAGALIAIGVWAGLRPDDLNEFLASRCGRLGLVRSMFSIGDVFAVLATWIWAILLVFLNFILRVVGLLLVPAILWLGLSYVAIDLTLRIPIYLSVLGIGVFFFRRVFQLRLPWLLESYPGCPGKKFERLINDMIRKGLSKRGIHPKLIQDMIDNEGEFWPTFRDIWRLSHWIRLVNNVTSLNDPDYGRVEEFYPTLKSKRKELHFGSGSHSNNIWQLVYGTASINDPYFAPVFISTCCVDDCCPVLFNNIEERYWDVPIAHIVRASAGYPTVFRPKSLTLEGKSKRYTDGGLMANFPAFAVNQALRRLFSRNNTELPDDYKTIRTLPYGTFGLAVSDQAARGTYLSVLRDVLMGGARERLEYEIASTSPYFRLVRQTTTGEPYFLNFFRVKPKLIDMTSEKAAQYIDGLQLSSTVDLDSLRHNILHNLKGAIELCERTFSIGSGGYIRGQLFIESATQQGTFHKKAAACKGRTITEFSDIKGPVAKEFAGLLGLVRSSSCPIFCRIDLLQEKRRRHPGEQILGLTIEHTLELPPDLNFSFVIPIFDYGNVTYETGQILKKPVPKCEDCVSLIDTGIAGPLIGAISIEGCSDDAKQDFKTLMDRIIENDILVTLERYAWEISALITDKVVATIG